MLQILRQSKHRCSFWVWIVKSEFSYTCTLFTDHQGATADLRSCGGVWGDSVCRDLWKKRKRKKKPPLTSWVYGHDFQTEPNWAKLETCDHTHSLTEVSLSYRGYERILLPVYTTCKLRATGTFWQHFLPCRQGSDDPINRCLSVFLHAAAHCGFFYGVAVLPGADRCGEAGSSGFPVPRQRFEYAVRGWRRWADPTVDASKPRLRWTCCFSTIIY